jgi:hypothetical protein
MTLPETLDNKWLRNIDDWLGNNTTLKISDKNANVGTFGSNIPPFFAVDNNGRFVETLYYCKFNEKSFTDVMIMYADRDVIVTGFVQENEYSGSFGMSLKKGWNKVYYTEYETKIIISTKAVEGVKWYFWGDWMFKNTKNTLEKIQNKQHNLFKRIEK